MKFSHFLHDLSLAIDEFDLDFDCFSKGQLESKEWLVKTMKDVQLSNELDYGIIFILCGWYGILSAIIWLNSIKFKYIRSFDIDARCKEIADRINRTNLQNEWMFQAVSEDIFSINFNDHMYNLWSYGKKEWVLVQSKPDTIINTSCEHTNSLWFNNIPSGKVVILQSNDFLEGKDHINCMSDLEEFLATYPLQHVYYKGQLKFQKYTRFMIIGEK